MEFTDVCYSFGCQPYHHFCYQQPISYDQNVCSSSSYNHPWTMSEMPMEEVTLIDLSQNRVVPQTAMNAAPSNDMYRYYVRVESEFEPPMDFLEEMPESMEGTSFAPMQPTYEFVPVLEDVDAGTHHLQDPHSTASSWERQSSTLESNNVASTDSSWSDASSSYGSTPSSPTDSLPCRHRCTRTHSRANSATSTSSSGGAIPTLPRDGRPGRPRLDLDEEERRQHRNETAKRSRDKRAVEKQLWCESMEAEIRDYEAKIAQLRHIICIQCSLPVRN